MTKILNLYQKQEACLPKLIVHLFQQGLFVLDHFIFGLNIAIHPYSCDKMFRKNNTA